MSSTNSTNVTATNLNTQTTRAKDKKFMEFGFMDGQAGSAAVDQADVAADDTTIAIDTVAVTDSGKLLYKGDRFTLPGDTAVRCISAANNSQIFTVTIDATGGTYALILNGQTTGALAYNANAAAIQAALEALSGVTAGDALVTGSGPYTVTMAANLANVSTNTLLSDATLLTGGASTAVIATVQDGTETYSITFTPAITAGLVPADNAVITVLPKTLQFEIGEGNFDWNEPADPQVRLSRGKIIGVRNGDEQALTFNASFIWNFLKSSSGDELYPYELFESPRVGDALLWVNAAKDVCDPFAVTMYAVDLPECGSELAEIYLFRHVYKTDINPNVDDGIVNLTGLCAVTQVERKRVANNADAIRAALV